LRFYEGSSNRDIAKLLDGILLGAVACILLYTVFGLVLVRMRADMISAEMELFLRNGLHPLIAPDDPYLQSLRRQLASALFFGVPLGVLTALLAGAVSIVPWARGRWGMPIEPLLSLVLVPAVLFLTFSGEAPALSVLCAVLTPLFFWIPWIQVQKRREPRKRNGLRAACFVALFLLPLATFQTVSSLGVRNLLLGLPAGNLLIDFYYDHTLLAAQVIKPPVYQTQKAVAVPQEVRLAEPLPCGTLLIRHPDPCGVAGASLVMSRQGLDCPAYLLSPAEAEESGQIVLRKASERFDRNKSLRRGIRWFFRLGLTAASLLLILRFAVFLEDLFQRRRTAALALLLAGLLPPAQGLYSQHLLHALKADPNRTAREYASSASATKRYLSVVHCPWDLPAEDLVRLSTDPNPRVRHFAFIAMGLIMDPAFLPALQEGVRDPEQIVRTKVYQALGRVGREDALPWLDRAIEQDPSWYARVYAYEARCDVERIYEIVETD
jgi:hypothetical protein